MSDKRLYFWADWRHWVVGVEGNRDEIAIRLLWFTINFLRRGVNG